MNTKSRLISFILTLILGPIGLFYSSPWAAIGLIIFSIATGGFGVILAWPISIFVGDSAVVKFNDINLLESERHNELVAALAIKKADNERENRNT